MKVFHYSARRVLAVFAAFLVCLCSISRAADSSNWESQTREFFREHCLDCHGPEAPEAGLDLSSISEAIEKPETFATWERIYDRVDAGEMPPSDAGTLSAKAIHEFSSGLKAALIATHAKSKAARLRRLNRREYQNTMNDLFGTELDLESLFPEDGRSHEFDNVRSALSLSMVQLQRYIEAADLVLDRAIAKKTKPPETKSLRANYAETREGEKHIGSAWGQAPDGAVVFFRALGYPTGMLRTANVLTTGRYRIRVTGYAFQSEEPITFAVGGTTFQRGQERPTYGYFSFMPGEPQTLELTAWIPERYMVEITPWGISDDDYLIKKNGIEAYAGPGLAINEVELIGPLVEEFPSRGHKLVFQEFERTEIAPSNPRLKEKSWYVPKFELSSSDIVKSAEATLLRIAKTAFRREVSTTEINRYVTLFENERNRTGDVETALRSAIAAVFCSTDFLFISENTSGDTRHLDSHSLATRLSYFLSRTSPDRELQLLAKSGDLRSNLKQQTDRLLDDSRLDRFITDFSDAWLNLRELDFTMPDRNLYPEYDAFLRFSIERETRAFLKQLIATNAPIRELWRPKFAMLNNRLALHYGIPDVYGPELRPVTVPRDSIRGGLLGQASIHKVTANGTNTSPVVRGVFVTERLLGKTVPPPPPGISGVEPDIRGASTLRELLDKHRDADNCRSCHAMIDPPGFALEDFNPIGGYRERFRSMGTGDKVNLVINAKKVRYRLGLDVDSSGQDANGNNFADFQEFRDNLDEYQQQIAIAFVGKLLTFSTGREIGFSDRDEIQRIVAGHSESQYRIRDLVHAVVASDIFQSR